ncbi:Cytidine deaminase [Petrocella atlantisensis]|uniref:Cytidine deaminase n=1 Tax=Petrocella atlantisensis TaxID=2173034 RepID=A0A3P7P0R9_9FIRM|nr:cytidine deaminase [Petrocella atlantisensis]VDN47060.1 Cytidine deaminase [Petrocella atlantisensis]
MNTEKKIQIRAIEFIKHRYPSGWGGAAVIRTEKDNYYTSIALETANAAVSICIETGAMCEAHKNNEKVTHCICVVRDDENSLFKVLTPCGVCQERLRYWGEDVRVGITTKENQLKFIELKELQPHHWSKAYQSETLEHYQNMDLK